MQINNPIEDISILLAEDEEELREYLREYLQIFFKDVFIAKCGKEAYEQYKQHHPDIILTDINMPNLDGLSLISKIREEDTKTKIIIISAHSEQEKLLKAIELNLVTYLIKPIKTDTLKKVIFELIEVIRKSTKRIYIDENIYWDKNTHSLWENEKEIILKEKESQLIELLCSNINHPFSPQEIFKHLYINSKKEFSEYAITSFIKRLRMKLPANIIQNEYGFGYKIVTKG
jgi:DNA-binding response OmpR family regulator